MKSIFDNTKFGSLDVSSRIIRNGLWESQNDSGKNLSQEVFDRYEKLAKNNVGVIVSELISMYSHDRFSDFTDYINASSFIRDFREITSIAHENNTPILAQIGFVNCNVNGKQMMEVNDLTLEDIRTIQADYVVAAKKIKFAGFDGVELCIGNNFYLSRVMDPFENTRNDEYGGNVYNRVKMVLEIIKLIKKTTGLHVHCKVNLYKDEDDSFEICKILAENGADSLQITRFLSPQYFRKGQNQDMLVSFADRVAKNVSIPVVLGGGMSDMDNITELLNNTDIDFISMQRPFVKDPAFLTQWKKEGHGKSECKTCNNCYWKKESVCLIKNGD